MTARQRPRWWTGVALLALGAMLLAACSAGSEAPQTAATMESAAAADGAPRGGGAENGAGGAYDTATSQLAVTEQSGADLGVSAPPADAAFQRKIIRNADLSLRVENAREAMAELQNLAAYSRGYVVDARLEGSDEDGWRAHLVMRIPVGNYDSALAQIRELGTVRQERQYTQDVTDQYYDLEARIRIAEEYLAKLRELAEKAEDFDEWLKLTRQINETQVEIENMTGRLNRLKNQVAYSTINVTLTQPAPDEPPEVEPPATLWGRMTQAFRNSADGVWEFAQAVLVLLAAMVPGLVFLALLIAAVWLIVLPLRRRRREGGPPAGPQPPAGPPSSPQGGGSPNRSAGPQPPPAEPPVERKEG